MSNHIAAKFIGLVYAPTPKESFLTNIPKLIEALRNRLPRYETPEVNDITINLDGGNFAAQKNTNGKELHMVDAEGLYGVRIGNNGLIVSYDTYVENEKLMAFFDWVTKKVTSVLNISHFAHLFLRNINIFQEATETSNKFANIRDHKFWGRQELPSLEEGYVCSGAATRHEYLSSDYLNHIQLSSGIVLPSQNQSYIPQDEWAMWKLRGNIPTLKNVHLLIDIAVTGYVSPINVPSKQHNVIEFDSDIVSERLNALHTQLNKIYFDIVEED
jgi:uncharacterized protein (TIGR04255 family)